MAAVVRKTVCPHDCPDTCSILATVEDGRVLSCDGDPDHPFTQGGQCHKVHRYAERIYSPLRVRSPMRRAGKEGEGGTPGLVMRKAGHAFFHCLGGSRLKRNIRDPAAAG